MLEPVGQGMVGEIAAPVAIPSSDRAIQSAMSNSSRNHDTIKQLAREIWETRGQPKGCDLEIWLEAEKQSSTGSAEADVRGSGKSQESTTPADPETTAPAPTPIQQEVKSAQRKKSEREPQKAVKANPAKLEPAATGKPLWPKPKSR